MIYCTNAYPFTCLTAHSSLQTIKGWRCKSSRLLCCVIRCNSYQSFKGSQCVHSHGKEVQEESPPIYPTTKHIPYNLHLWQHCCENLKPRMRKTVEMKFIAPRMDDTPSRCREKIANFELPASTRPEGLF